MTDSVQTNRTGTDDALFFAIPVSRLIIASLLSCGLYEGYWIYRNWAILKRRHTLSIWPLCRGVFGIFTCHDLLRRVHDDLEASAIRPASFSPGLLATGFVVATLLGTAATRGADPVMSVVGFLVPTFLFLVPVQRYINTLQTTGTPPQSYASWSKGQLICVGIGVIIWGVTLSDFLSSGVLSSGPPQAYTKGGLHFSHFPNWSVVKDGPIEGDPDQRIVRIEGPADALVQFIIVSAANLQTLEGYADAVAAGRVSAIEQSGALAAASAARVSKATSEPTNERVNGEELEGIRQLFSVSAFGQPLVHEALFFLVATGDRKVFVMTQVPLNRPARVREGMKLILNTLALDGYGHREAS
jgi:hypothetical protein